MRNKIVPAEHCKLKGCKKRRSAVCDMTKCFPFILMHGPQGTSGFWNMNNVPKLYRNLIKKDLDGLCLAEENPKVHQSLIRYIDNIEQRIDVENVGLYLYSKASGTGKTTTAVILMNEYLIYRVESYLKSIQERKADDVEQEKLDQSPVFFVSASEFQNVYNEQFRGIDSGASERYYLLKKRMKNVDLLVIDDIAVRDVTEAFNNELFEIIDYRASEMKAVIITSNSTLDELEHKLGQRITSRIKGMCVPVGLSGSDKRKVGNR